MIKKNLGGFGRTIDTSNYQAIAKAVRDSRAIRADFERNKKIIETAVRPSPPAAETLSLADQIVRAGKRARGELPTAQEFDLKPNANDSPAVAKAKLILLAGKRRRGEI
jgi:hypothetical protein